MPTFAAAAEAVLAQMRPGWRNPKHGKDWLSSMERFAFPRLGKLPVSEVTSADVVEALRAVWHERPATARRVRQRISTVMEWAVAMNYRDDNPCSRIGPVLGPQQDLVRHMRALPHRDVAAVVETVRASGAAPVVKLAFEFLVLTAARSGEVRGAEWAEIDTAEHVWTVPATRTKAKREHRVPLTRRAEQILDAARTLSNGNALVFPSPRGKRFNDMALSGLLKTLAVPAVPHGFRSTFRDWAAEETNHPARGRRGRAGPRRAEQGRGRLRAVGPLRTPSTADGRLGRLSQPNSAADHVGSAVGRGQNRMLLIDQVELLRQYLGQLRNQQFALPLMGGRSATRQTYQFKSLVHPARDIATKIADADPGGNKLPARLRGWNLDTTDELQRRQRIHLTKLLGMIIHVYYLRIGDGVLDVSNDEGKRVIVPYGNFVDYVERLVLTRDDTCLVICGLAEEKLKNGHTMQALSGTDSGVGRLAALSCDNHNVAGTPGEYLDNLLCRIQYDSGNRLPNHKRGALCQGRATYGDRSCCGV